MANLKIQKLTKRAKRLRMAIVGPTGSGKTFTGLLLLREITGQDKKILVIDSERESAGLYAEEFNGDGLVDTIVLTDHAPDTYIDALELAAGERYGGILIDSLSHAWMGKEGALEQVDKATKRSQSKNSFTAWREVTPMHNRLVDAILAYPGHLIATLRVKTEYVVEKDEKGNAVPKKIGLSPVQRDGIEYEFDILADMDMSHNFIVSKTRMNSLKDLVVNEPGNAIGARIRAWLDGGVIDARMILEDLRLSSDQKRSLAELGKSRGFNGSQLMPKLEEIWAAGARTFAEVCNALEEIEAVADPVVVSSVVPVIETARVAPVAETAPVVQETLEIIDAVSSVSPVSPSTTKTPLETLGEVVDADTLDLWARALKASGSSIETVAADYVSKGCSTLKQAKAIYATYKNATAPVEAVAQ